MTTVPERHPLLKSIPGIGGILFAIAVGYVPLLFPIEAFLNDGIRIAIAAFIAGASATYLVQLWTTPARVIEVNPPDVISVQCEHEIESYPDVRHRLRQELETALRLEAEHLGLSEVAEGEAMADWSSQTIHRGQSKKHSLIAATYQAQAARLSDEISALTSANYADSRLTKRDSHSTSPETRHALPPRGRSESRA